MVTKKKTTAKKKRTPNAAFMKPMNISDELAQVVGSKPIPRTEVTKKLWVYIKKNKLQDSVNKRNINADAAQRAIKPEAFRGGWNMNEDLIETPLEKGWLEAQKKLEKRFSKRCSHFPGLLFASLLLKGIRNIYFAISLV